MWQRSRGVPLQLKRVQDVCRTCGDARQVVDDSRQLGAEGDAPDAQSLTGNRGPEVRKRARRNEQDRHTRVPRDAESVARPDAWRAHSS